MNRGEGRGCFKRGCLGCVGLTLVVGLILAILIAIGFLTGRGEERFEPIDRSQALPTFAAPIDGLSPTGDVEEPGRIVLDVHRVMFAIEPGPPGTPIRLDGNINVGSFDLEESFEPYGESGWTYKLEFDQKGFGIRPFVVDDEKENRLTLIVPRGTPIVIEGLVGIGRSEMQLGGLWLLDVNLDVGIGEHEMRFDEPLAAPMRRLRLDTAAGELRVESVGNASPGLTEIHHSIGETSVDLSGEWAQDAEAYVWCGVGACEVRIPDNINVDLDRVSVVIGESGSPHEKREHDPASPTLKVAVSGNIGEVWVRD